MSYSLQLFIYVDVLVVGLVLCFVKLVGSFKGVRGKGKLNLRGGSEVRR